MKLTAYDTPMRPDKEWRAVAIRNGIRPGTYHYRVRAGWSRHAAATVPTRPLVTRNADQLARETGLTYHAAYNRIVRSSDE